MRRDGVPYAPAVFCRMRWMSSVAGEMHVHEKLTDFTVSSLDGTSTISMFVNSPAKKLYILTDLDRISRRCQSLKDEVD
jgi:hypothetical protein